MSTVSPTPAFSTPPATAPPAPPPPTIPPATEDPGVALAFALGWQVAELYRDPHHERADTRPLPDYLPGIGSLTESQRTDLGIRQIEAGLHRLSARIYVAGLSPPAVAPLRDAFAGGSGPATGQSIDLRPRVLSLHREILETLSAADFRLGKAYGLGRAMAETGEVSDAGSLARRFEHSRIRQLDAWLADLDTALPAHASGSVRKSLACWGQWAHDPHLDAGPRDCSHRDGAPLDWQRDARSLRQALDRQIQLWRSLLSGEKAGVDMLKTKDYVAAIREMLGRARDVVWAVLRHLWFVVVLIAALIAAGVALLATSDTASGNIAAVAALAAGVGVTWKGVGEAIWRAASRLERPLWGAAINTAINEAITQLPKSPAEPMQSRGR